MSAKNKNKSLKDTHVSISRMCQKNTTQNTVLSWRVPKYEELKNDVMHFQMYETRGLKCILRIFKHKDILHLSVSGDTFQKTGDAAEFFLLDEISDSQLRAKAEEVCEGVFVGKFPHPKFMFPNSNYLHNGVLTVVFKYVSDFFVAYKESNLDESEVLGDPDELCYDLKSMYLESIFPDFYIHARDVTFKTHRFILASRSKYFDRFFEAGSGCSEIDHFLPDDILPGILHHVLLYVYCGEIRDMDLEAILETYKVAVHLEVPSLCDRCEEYFRTTIDRDNYLEICEYAVKFQLKGLKNVIVRAMNGKFPEINILEVFKQVGEDKGKNADLADARKR